MMNFSTALITIVIALFIGSLVGTAAGALGGLVVGLFFTNTINAAMVAFGFSAIPVWKLGAFLGFVGGFFRTINTEKTS